MLIYYIFNKHELNIICIVINYTILYCTILYYIALYYTILYCTILYYTILYYTTLYYTIPGKNKIIIANFPDTINSKSPS